jgi:ribonuclease R
LKINKTKIEQQAKWCSERELIAAKAQRDSIKYKQVEYLSDKIGHVYDGIVTGVTDFGIHVELIDSKCEGMLKYTSLNGKWYPDLNNYLVTDKLGSAIRLGDELKVIVSSVDLERKQINFTKL